MILRIIQAVAVGVLVTLMVASTAVVVLGQLIGYVNIIASFVAMLVGR